MQNNQFLEIEIRLKYDITLIYNLACYMFVCYSCIVFCRLIMLEKHVEHDKYALTELSNGEGKDNVFATPENAFNDIPEKNDDEDKNRDIDVLHEMKFRNALPQVSNSTKMKKTCNFFE